jgi:hypothetical protein
MLTKTFWFGESGVLVRAVRTWAQTAVAAIGVGTTNLFSADIKNVLALASSAAILSILMSLDRNTAASTVVVESAAAVVPASNLQSSYTGDVR